MPIYHTDDSAHKELRKIQERHRKERRHMRYLRNKARMQNIAMRLSDERRDKIRRLLEKDISKKTIARRVGLPHGFIVWFWEHEL